MKPIIVNGICIYRNILKIHTEIIEASELMSNTNEVNAAFIKAKVVNADGSKCVSDSVRNNAMMFTPKPDYQSELVAPELEFANNIHKIFIPCINDFANRFGIAFNEKSTTGYQVLKYSINEFYISHLDDGPQTKRSISTIGYLNDNFEGGELYFKDINFTYYPFAGDIVIFPSGAPFAHEARPVLSGTKYCIVNWW